MTIAYKFEKLEVWQLALQYVDLIYEIAEQLPKREEYNLGSQIRRAATSVALNIAEGSTGQSDPEQARFLGYALRSVIETVACQHLIRRRPYQVESGLLENAYDSSEILSKKLQAMRRAVTPAGDRVREEDPGYLELSL
jgi:four helix bundle protein